MCSSDLYFCTGRGARAAGGQRSSGSAPREADQKGSRERGATPHSKGGENNIQNKLGKAVGPSDRGRFPGSAPASDLQYIVTLVAHADIYGELRKLFSNVTDTQHLDAIPRMELIDAVDADGDGRAELLFREISDAGTAFNIYRVTGDQLWPLFEGKPGM